MVTRPAPGDGGQGGGEGGVDVPGEEQPADGVVTRGVVGYFGLWARREKEVALAGVLEDPGGE